MGAKDAVEQGVRVKAMQMQVLGKLVTVDVHVETWTPGAELMGERSQYTVKAIAFGKIYTGWPDSVFVSTCFSLYLNSCCL